MLDSRYSKANICAALSSTPSTPDSEPVWPAQSPAMLTSLLTARLKLRRVPAAVLIPLIERSKGLSVLLTQRAANLREHAGQVSFPGGRIEPTDRDPWSAALREAGEEIGLAAQSVEFGGYLPDHLVGTGFRVTPAVGFLRPDFNLTIDAAEVQEVFEIPLEFALDPANRQLRHRNIGEDEVAFHDIAYQNHNIWGATAGMLVTLQNMLAAAAAQA
jgi:8-oxo-dGTP pyrophosphatase MutT (NUDIX family)